jgi:hypothetical protein
MARSSLSRRQLLGTLVAAPVGAAILLPVGLSAAQQVHMQAAKESLDAALAHLEQATNDKGGHRVAAVKATKVALEHVEKGIRFDRRN